MSDIRELITLVDGEFACPLGFRIVLSDVQQQARNIVDISRNLQKIFFLKNSSFAKDKNDLQFFPFSMPLTKYYDYSINILENGKLAETVTTPKSDNLKSYISGIFHLNGFSFRSILCVSKQSTKNISQSIKLVDGKFACPTGFEVAPHRDVENEAQETISSILWQNYFKVTQNSLNNQNNFAELILLSNTYYNYKSDLLEEDKLFQVIATPKFDTLKSYISAQKVNLNLNDGFQSIVCASEQPTKDTSKSIKLVDGKLYCPTSFEMVFSENE
ncbi:MAG: type IV pilin-like G/H family protein [Pleurocapsa minor HA4230-MV1]|nr:type IV pilin-like G/H family protein [Pleurocapsa minor HA4230-MV1]